MTKIEINQNIKKRKKSWKSRDFWIEIDWKKLGLRHGLPILCSLILGLFIGFKFGSLTVAISKTEQKIGLIGTVDLPEQVSALQNTQLDVLENTLKLLDQNSKAEAEKSEGKNIIGDMIATINYQNELNGFFKTYLGLDYKTNAESRFLLLKNYFADNVTGDRATKLTDNIMVFLEGPSWAIDNNSQTALAGNVIPSIIAGSNDNNVLYHIIVPATNEKREFVNLSYIVKMDRNKKIVAVTYQGTVTDNGDIQTWYENLNSALSGLPLSETSYDNLFQNPRLGEDDQLGGETKTELTEESGSEDKEIVSQLED